MKIIAYISVRHYLFAQMIPGISSEDFKITPVILHNVLEKLNPENVREEFSSFWDYVFTNEKYDALWSYHRPDEITLAKCRQYNVSVLIQEFFGRYPFELPSLLLSDCDFEEFYRGKNLYETAPKSPNERPVITVPVEELIFPEEDALDIQLKRRLKDPRIKMHKISYWNTDRLMSSRIDFIKKIVEIFSTNEDIRSCKLLFRPKLSYMELFSEEIDYIKKLNMPNVSLDFSEIKESLENTDIIVCMHSNYAVDGIRAGCESIIYGNKAFYCNPQLVTLSGNPFELEISLKEKIKNVRSDGKKIKPFMPHLIKDMQGPLRCTCEHPYDHVQMKNAILHAHSMPRLKHEKE
ncbi:MAG: hypothetical protein A2017_00865 [Lentisphaerae bacterium GWF2_44_16]|nr:MAG: hypothetical protein A2017_00865 [Lentisphaerae bacterium GWF2_44_16]